MRHSPLTRGEPGAQEWARRVRRAGTGNGPKSTRFRHRACARPYQGKLRKAAQAWTTTADTLTGGAYAIPEALASIRAQKSPEVDDAATVCEAMMGHIQDCASACRELSAACTELADHIDKAHKEIEHELVVLLEWTVAIEAAGAVASFFSFGAAEIPTQAAEAGRIAATAGRIAAIISRLIEFGGTFAARISGVLSRIGELAARCKKIISIEKRAVETTKAAGALDKEATALAKIESAAETGAASDRAALEYATRADKLEHVFVSKHKLEPLVQQFGSREAVMEQVIRTIRSMVPATGKFEVTCNIGGQAVVVRGAVVDGVPKIGTMFTP